MPGAEDQSGGITATGTAIGLGTKVQSVQTDFQQGAFLTTDNTFDVAIAGKGFFQVQDTDGTTVYTRSGNFSVNAQGQLVMGSASVGRLVQGGDITIPEDRHQRHDHGRGRSAVLGGWQHRTPVGRQYRIGHRSSTRKGWRSWARICIAKRLPPERRRPPRPARTAPESCEQGMLEASNVSPVAELIELITTQRSFELNSQAVQAGDQILQLVSNLRRY